MKQLIVASKVKLDTKFSTIFCDDINVYVVNKNNKFVRVYNHNLELTYYTQVFLDWESICFDTDAMVFYTLKYGEETIISRLDKEFNIINEKRLKLNNQPTKISYNKNSKGLYLYTENSIMEFNAEKIKLIKIINPYEETYSPIVNNNFDFNLWEKQNDVSLEFNEEYKILDVASYDNKFMYMLAILDNEYYIYKCGISSNEFESSEVHKIDVNSDNFEGFSLFEGGLERVFEDLELDSYFRGKHNQKLANYIDWKSNDNHKSNYDKSFDDILSQNKDNDCECKKRKCNSDFDNCYKDKPSHKKHSCTEYKDECFHECKKDCCDINKSCCEIIHSVAFVELGISHILNAEGEKIQKVVKCSDSICEILETNNSVIEVIEKITRLEDILCSKLKLAKEICAKENTKCEKTKHWD